MSNDMRRVLPWSADEYLHVDGYRLVYTADPLAGITKVHLPGGRSSTVDELRLHGYRVEMPERIRHAS
jgi:hypothetical protein